MPIVLRLPLRNRSARPVVMICVALSAALLAACGNSSTPAPSGTSTPSSTVGVTASGAASSASPGTSPDSSAGEASTSASGGVDACALFSSAELAVIVGGEIKGAEMLAGGWVVSACAWSGSTSSFILSAGTASSIQKFGDAAAPDIKAKLQQYKQQVNGSDVVGIGDGAVLGANGMAAYKGSTYVELEKLRLTDTQLQKIMKLLVSRL